jgi:predicted pyridoxine 5'-phosphate oxidase superfamily flavin-nucleotide-binding protein
MAFPESKRPAEQVVSMYHEGCRTLQDKFDSRRLADRLEQVQVHAKFTREDRVFIERSAMFFLATADAQGRPDCSYKGGMPGFVRVADEQTLAFPDYNGNGMFRSLGNILVNRNVSMLFIDFEHPDRLIVNGTATVHDDDPLLVEYPGAQLIIRVHLGRALPNCPRYMHKMRLVRHSVFVPRENQNPPVPNWKRWDEFRSVLPAGDAGIKASLATYIRRARQRSSFAGRCVDKLRAVMRLLNP